MVSDSKKLVSTILMGSPDGEKPAPEKDDGADSALTAIAHDLLDAVKGNSVGGVVDALKAFFSEIQSADEEQDAEQEQGESEE